MAHSTLDDVEERSAGDAAAVIRSQGFLKSLVEDNHASLIRFLRRRLGDTDEVHDIAQDLYCQIARQPDTSSIRQPRAYLFRAARNLILNRRQHRHCTHADGHFSIDEACESEVICAAPSPERVTQDRQKLQIVAKAVEELSPKCRKAFLLVRFEGLTYKQTAAEMGLSVKSIEYYMRQALNHICARVDAENAEERRRQAAE